MGGRVAPKATCSLAFAVHVHPDVNSGSALKLQKMKLLHYQCVKFNKLCGPNSVSQVCLKSFWGS